MPPRGANPTPSAMGCPLAQPALVFLAAVAAGIALTTQKGAAFREMLKEARVELRKVIWPTRVETGQTTAIVVVVVLIVALILWALDSLFAWIIASLIG